MAPAEGPEKCGLSSGTGLLTTTALVGTVGHRHAFRRARQRVSWLGLTPREQSSGARHPPWAASAHAAMCISGAMPVEGVVARIVTGPHDAHRQDPHLPMRYETT